MDVKVEVVRNGERDRVALFWFSHSKRHLTGVHCCDWLCSDVRLDSTDQDPRGIQRVKVDDAVFVLVDDQRSSTD